MDWFVSITAEQWTAAGTWSTVVVALVAATVGLRQVREARRLREDQAQPHVVAIMEQNLTAPSIIEIAFRNYGTTAARNIHVMSTPKLRCTDGHGGVQDVWVPDVIPMLAPGQEWRTFWDDGPLRLACDELRGEDAHRIVITCDGVDRTGQQTTTSVLDWAAHRGRLFVQAKTMDDAAGALHDISQTIARWSSVVGGGQLGFAHPIGRPVNPVTDHHGWKALLTRASARETRPPLVTADWRDKSALLMDSFGGELTHV